MMPWSMSRTSCAGWAKTASGPIRGPVLDVIADASQEVRSGVLYATIVIVLVFVPLFAMSGLEGRLFTPLGIAYIVSILGSLLVSITVTPVLSYYLFRGPRGRDHDGVSSSRISSAPTWRFCPGPCRDET